MLFSPFSSFPSSQLYCSKHSFLFLRVEVIDMSFFENFFVDDSLPFSLFSLPGSPPSPFLPISRADGSSFFPRGEGEKAPPPLPPKPITFPLCFSCLLPTGHFLQYRRRKIFFFSFSHCSARLPPFFSFFSNSKARLSQLFFSFLPFFPSHASESKRCSFFFFFLALSGRNLPAPPH